ncbi:SprT family zinc-dependent metalloprotease [Oceanobacter sp. 5_MG-2023]|uniref:M48 family metallopeptidase n=1 Tax=Oceanobacter sp. 5_MG-2023 TaxID=3062645 RepID=UPI0026E3BA9A|nr:SprT family zinc-dependent metalloprotease [Oceanobacter sp. 5_MG-2023]MDO6683507.1 SprT family zinc-dependent metalloprotease [Oceanobacter sp. 5_MG-2023]
MKGYKQQLLVPLDGEDVVLHIQAMKRKSLRLVLNPAGEIDLRIPLGASKAQVNRFLDGHQAWLIQRRREWKENQSRNECVLKYLGRTLTLVETDVAIPQVCDDQLLVPAMPAGQRQALMDDWLKQQARSTFSDLLDCWWPRFQQYGVERPVLRVKKMRTRWGSLSRKGYINLNMALIHMPEPLIELVVVHELCHIRHFDHGPGFRRLMAFHLADCRLREQTLDQYHLNGFLRSY